ncbi:abc transporter b family member mitochondrial [Hordeum vulgare]|nr:abc transporter b family member mitochondrial [Hordeum vulgare]
MKREWADELEDRELVDVKQEPEEIARRGIVGPDDYVGGDVDTTVVTNLAAKEKDDEWWRIREEQKQKFINLVSSNEED